MPTDYARFVVPQFEAALAQLTACIRVCPPEHWDATIGKYPFWHVAYHALMYVDCYLAPSNDAFVPRPQYLPAGRAELEDEFPSRHFAQSEILAYAQQLRTEVAPAINRETPATLEGPSGFAHIPITRAEHHLHSIRHIQHHTGQLSAVLRRHNIATPWVKTGWRD